jgi:hypothetical protein
MLMTPAIYHYCAVGAVVAGIGWAVAILTHTVCRGRVVRRLTYSVFSFLLPLSFLCQLLSSPLAEQSTLGFLMYFLPLCGCLLVGAITAKLPSRR